MNVQKSTAFKSIKNKKLLCDKAFLAGDWEVSTDKKTISVLNPTDQKLLAKVPKIGPKQLKKNIEIAQIAQKNWASISAKERGKFLKNMAELMLQNKKDLALIVTLEQGKPLFEAEAEIVYAASFLEWFGEEARRIYADVIPSPMSDRRLITIKEPVGLAAAITPWNFPSAMIARKLGAALATGCALIVKPDQKTPLSALAYGKIAEMAKLPKGVLSVVTGEAADIGLELTQNPKIKKISFTGSTRVGKILLSQSADSLKKLSLELGGNAPFIVFNDANVDKAVLGAIQSKYRNAGQTCICANRIYVQKQILDKFTKKYTKAVSELKVGSGLESKVTIGPLIDENAVKKISAHIEDALTKGAKILLGGKKHQLGGNFFEPTVLSGANKNMRLAKEETFGPLSPIFSFESEKDAVKLANDTQYGLAAYFYARDLGTIWRVSEALEYGMIGINSGVLSFVEAPFGGIKHSGFGREGSKYGVDEYLQIKYLCLAGIDE